MHSGVSPIEFVVRSTLRPLGRFAKIRERGRKSAGMHSPSQSRVLQVWPQRASVGADHRLGAASARGRRKSMGGSVATGKRHHARVYGSTCAASDQASDLERVSTQRQAASGAEKHVPLPGVAISETDQEVGIWTTACALVFGNRIAWTTVVRDANRFLLRLQSKCTCRRCAVVSHAGRQRATRATRRSAEMMRCVWDDTEKIDIWPLPRDASHEARGANGMEPLRPSKRYMLQPSAQRLCVPSIPIMLFAGLGGTWAWWHANMSVAMWVRRFLA